MLDIPESAFPVERDRGSSSVVSEQPSVVGARSQTLAPLPHAPRKPIELDSPAVESECHLVPHLILFLRLYARCLQLVEQYRASRRSASKTLPQSAQAILTTRLSPSPVPLFLYFITFLKLCFSNHPKPVLHTVHRSPRIRLSFVCAWSIHGSFFRISGWSHSLHRPSC
jgi:hypothetical protein